MQVRITFTTLQGNVNYSQIWITHAAKVQGSNQKSQVICQAGLELCALGSDPL